MSDVAKFRNALRNAGFPLTAARATIFNDKSKATGIRRLKLRNAYSVFSASDSVQKRLEKHLRKEFGSRIAVMYFIPVQHHYYRVPSDIRSLCIKLYN